MHSSEDDVSKNTAPKLKPKLSTISLGVSTQPLCYDESHVPSQRLLDVTLSSIDTRSPRLFVAPADLEDGGYFDVEDVQQGGSLRSVSPPNFDAYTPTRPTMPRFLTSSRLTAGFLSGFLGAGKSLHSGAGRENSVNYYDDFSISDSINSTIELSAEQHELERRAAKSLKWKLILFYYSLQEWILIVIIAFLSSLLAYVINKSESLLIDLKRGYCSANIFKNKHDCCHIAELKTETINCSDYKLWSELLHTSKFIVSPEFLIFLLLTLSLAYMSVKLTLTTKTHNPLPNPRKSNADVIYTAYGSGVPEVKTILSGFIIRRFLGTYTLFLKSVALVLAIASGMAIGKEGPYVHLSTCIGNICARLFTKINTNSLLKRQILSASASAGVALAFGSPLGAVLFTIEEVSYYLPVDHLFRIFFCAIMSILFLKFLNPYQTGRAVLFEVSYTSDWRPFELLCFVIIGTAGGIHGSLFCKFTSWWGRTFRNHRLIKNFPAREVILVAFLTGILTFSNSATNRSTTELLTDLATPCEQGSSCPSFDNQLMVDGKRGVLDYVKLKQEFGVLFGALWIKLILTAVTFGIKVPSGIYVPSMVLGALFGRLLAMFLQILCVKYPSLSLLLFDRTFKTIGEVETCVDFGIYAMIGAGSFMAGITRMNVTLATILFELTSSYTYVLPISISIAVSNWVASLIEKKSLYELLIWKNDYPFLDNRRVPSFDPKMTLKDLLFLHERKDTSLINGSTIDIVESGFIKANDLRRQMNILRSKSLIDGCFTIVKNSSILVGVLPLNKLELQLDKIDQFKFEFSIENDLLVKLSDSKDFGDAKLNSDSVSNTLSKNDIYSKTHSSNLYDDLEDPSKLEQCSKEEIVIRLMSSLTDFTRIIDHHPLMLEASSPLSLVHMVFSRLGNREICVLDKGVFIGTLHKKFFIDYLKNEDKPNN
ncbi:Anion/proton exchange transporter [Komagataella phaffii CBS 7435]|uniref:Anion/proton exchange transporter n=1 Tax=Komagataella phaffii (strain ATCC 76273 / CBS 7435 / CECT 11047 / NRRL Y-11430 / Wegner 21-1) TaxID=981350 RepID=F2QZ50_KOMPC|nr:GQ67_04825T0 [Komagataella phaffii]AOA70420.1 GQ68_04797T0 [Komagataella phaffii GS115]CAH2450893.1 Anion/proton exchange transporter [Komagataella phaffii CBS 7435]CCA40678.1 Anion/proton exchange transporter [Komagataella phaffii CBS 7435]